jgi:hypothetical protein
VLATPGPGTYDNSDHFAQVASKARARTAPLRFPHGLVRTPAAHPGFHNTDDIPFLKSSPLVAQLSVKRNSNPGPASYHVKNLSIDGQGTFNFVHMESVVRGKQKLAVPKRVRSHMGSAADLPPSEHETLVLLEHKYRMKARPTTYVRDLSNKLGFNSTAERDCGSHFAQQF